jgi:diguanylate cyclase (GGDEF)-like protein
MVLGLFIISGVAIYSYSVFYGSMKELAGGGMGRVIYGADIYSVVSQIVADTERLVTADSDPERRIAYDSIADHFRQLESLGGTDGHSVTLYESMNLLETTLDELNSLVTSRIEISGRTAELKNELFGFMEAILRYDRETNSSKLADKDLKASSDWMFQLMETVNTGGQMSDQKSLYLATQHEKKIKDQFQKLKKLSDKLPKEMRQTCRMYEEQLMSILLGQGGLISLTSEQIKLSLMCSSRGNFARSLAGEFKSSNAAMLNELITNAAISAKDISEMLRKMETLFIILTIAATVVAVAVMVVFRKKLTGRLISLNRAILEHVDGHGAPIETGGNDEISEMAKSFIYFTKEVEKREDKLKQLAMEDPLTGVSNRRHFTELAAKELMRAQRFRHSAVMMMLDIDNFKVINDTYGHGAGDLVLKTVADACVKTLREVDLFGRFGGEEFAAFLPETGLDEGMKVAERIRAAVEKAVTYADEIRINCTLSIGVSVYSGGDADLLMYINAADTALYDAKKSGRNRVCHSA